MSVDKKNAYKVKSSSESSVHLDHAGMAKVEPIQTADSDLKDSQIVLVTREGSNKPVKLLVPKEYMNLLESEKASIVFDKSRDKKLPSPKPKEESEVDKKYYEKMDLLSDKRFCWMFIKSRKRDLEGFGCMDRNGFNGSETKRSKQCQRTLERIVAEKYADYKKSLQLCNKNMLGALKISDSEESLDHKTIFLEHLITETKALDAQMVPTNPTLVLNKTNIGNYDVNAGIKNCNVVVAVNSKNFPDYLFEDDAIFTMVKKGDLKIVDTKILYKYLSNQS